MDWVEMIHIRTYCAADTTRAVNVFNHLSICDPNTPKETYPYDIHMLRSHSVTNDLCIFLAWHGRIPKQGKSPLGLQLAAAFSKMGHINHSVWERQPILFFS